MMWLSIWWQVLRVAGRPGWVIPGLMAGLLGTTSADISPSQIPLQMVVFDAGEGQSILLQRGNRGILIDTGHAGVAENIVNRLKQRSVRKLDFIILSHLHPDHASGFLRVREAFPDSAVGESGFRQHWQKNSDITRWVADALDKDNKRKILSAGKVLNWQNVQIQVLWPENIAGTGLNYHSLVLRIRFGNADLLLMGDADQHVEKQLLEQGLLPSHAAVMIIGHHGASDTTSPAFLNNVGADYYVISVNADNLRGYPDKEVVQRLKSSDGTLLRTDLHGELCFQFVKTRRTTELC